MNKHPDRCRLVLFRKYSGVISMPKDFITLAWIPAAPFARKYKNFVGEHGFSNNGLPTAQTLFTISSENMLAPGCSDIEILYENELVLPRFEFPKSAGLSLPDDAKRAPLWLTVALPLALCFASPSDVVSCMRACRALYHSLSKSDALARAKLLHITCGAHEADMRADCKGHWKSAFAKFCDNRKFVRLARGLSIDSDEFFVLDVNCVLWRSVQVCRRPDSKAADKAKSDFLDQNPGNFLD